MQPTTALADPALLVGTATGDDAAVYRLDERTALVATVDFITPVVDDPYDWGRVAAVNSMSDVYAMGGRPLLCLNLVGWPADALPVDLLARVLEGGQAAAAEAGALVVGGHTIDDREPKYGMAVLGLADPERIVVNSAVGPGEELFLTKPLGLGVLTTGIKRDLVGEAGSTRVVEVMATSNRAAAEAMLEAGVRAATDVTGFGLLGHLHRMLEASGVAAEIWASRVPLLDGALEMVAKDAVPGGSRRNREFVEGRVSWDPDVPEEMRVLLADAQTSGGLLIACPVGSEEALAGGLAARGVLGARIGRAVDGRPGEIAVRRDPP